MGALVERFRRSRTAQQMAQGSLWSVSGAILSRIVGLATVTLVARRLGPHTFGEYGVVQNTAGVFLVFAGMGMGTTATKYVAELKDRDPEAAGRILGQSSLVALLAGVASTAILLFAAPWLCVHALDAPGLVRELQVGSGLLLWGALTSAQTGALAGFHAFKESAIVSVVGAALGAPLLVGGAYFGDLTGAVAGAVGSVAVQAVAGAWIISRVAARHGIVARYRGAEWRVVWGFSVPAMMSAVISMPAAWLCNVLIVNTPGGYEQMGLYTAANQWRNAVLFLPTTASAVLLPTLASAISSGQVGRFRKALLANGAAAVGVAALVALVVAGAAPVIMRSYGSSYAGAVLVLRVLCASAVLSVVPSVIGQAIASRGWMWLGFWLNGAWAVVLLAATAALRAQGAVGLATAQLIAYGFMLVASCACARSLLAGSGQRTGRSHES